MRLRRLAPGGAAYLRLCGHTVGISIVCYLAVARKQLAPISSRLEETDRHTEFMRPRRALRDCGIRSGRPFRAPVPGGRPRLSDGHRWV